MNRRCCVCFSLCCTLYSLHKGNYLHEKSGMKWEDIMYTFVFLTTEITDIYSICTYIHAVRLYVCNKLTYRKGNRGVWRELAIRMVDFYHYVLQHGGDVTSENIYRWNWIFKGATILYQNYRGTLGDKKKSRSVASVILVLPYIAMSWGIAKILSNNCMFAKILWKCFQSAIKPKVLV